MILSDVGKCSGNKGWMIGRPCDAGRVKCVSGVRKGACMDVQNLNLYHIFYTVARCRNISSAAKELYISQPAISKAVSKLEGNLHVTLFTRNSRGVRLTAEGELLYEQLDTAFHAISQGEEQLKRNEELGVGELSIGVSTTLCKYVLLPYLQTFMKENPYVRVSIFCQSTYETVAALENGTVDIGLVGEPDRMNALNFYPVQEISDIFVTTEKYMELLKESIKWSGEVGRREASALLSHATLLLLNKNNITRQYVDKYMLLQGINAKQQMEVSTMDLLIEFAKMGLGAACVISSFVEKELKEGTLIRFPMPAQFPPRKIGFASKSKANPTVSMRKFMKLPGISPES